MIYQDSIYLPKNGVMTRFKHGKRIEYEIINKHLEWTGEERTRRWNVNEIKNKKTKQITWCSDEFINEAMESLEAKKTIYDL